MRSEAGVRLGKLGSSGGPGSPGSVLNGTFYSEFQYVSGVYQIQDMNF